MEIFSEYFMVIGQQIFIGMVLMLCFVILITFVIVRDIYSEFSRIRERFRYIDEKLGIVRDDVTLEEHEDKGIGS